MARRKSVSAQTRVKLSQAAKRRQRGLKGTSLGGKFRAGAGSAGLKTWESRAGTGRTTPGSNLNPAHGTSGSHKREVYLDTLSDVKAGRIRETDLARGVTRSRLMGESGPSLSPADTHVGDVTRRVRSSDIRNVEGARREAGWQTERGLYATPDTAKGKKKAPAQFVSSEMPPSQRRWLEAQLKDPSSDFSKGLRMDSEGNVRNTTKGVYSPGQRNRVRIYTDALQEGATHTEALNKLQGERRGRTPSGTRRVDKNRERAATTLGRRAPSGRAGKYQSVIPSEKEFTVGVSSANADSIATLKRRFPNASERDLIRTQQFQRQYLADELAKNQKWAHETRQANITGGPKREASGNNVVFFTTNFGSPAPSVPADSLVGQYIIRRRKAMMKGNNLANDKELKGMFPDAVRDMHIMEASTGLSFGAEGRWGAFQKSGWRNQNKTSKNFGKPTPVGQTVLYDAQGRPMYDDNGNIRHTEGATRPFRFETMKDAGFRVFIG